MQLRGPSTVQSRLGLNKNPKMKSSILVLVCLVAYATARSLYGVAVPDYPCNTEDVNKHYPNPANASTFYQCAPYGLVLMPCPSGLEFDVVADRCEWPPVKPTDAPSSEEEVVVPEPEKCPLPKCSGAHDQQQYFANPKDCGSFYQCDAGQQLALHICPSGLHFNTNINVCDWPGSAKCTPCEE